MERLQVQFTRAQAERLREQARLRGISVAALVRESVDTAFKDALQAPSVAERWRRSRAAVGRYGSGSSDPVSEQHDAYLDETYRS